MTGLLQAGSFVAGGIHFTVLTNRRTFADRVSAAFRDLRTDLETTNRPVQFKVLHSGKPPPANPWAVWRDDEACETTVADDYVLSYLLWEVTRLMFEHSGDRVHLHGAALAYDGRALVLPGESHAGKSTLAGWLTHCGWEYLTDEAALVDPRALTVEPFWRPIGVRRPGPLDPILAAADLNLGDATEGLVPASRIGNLGQRSSLAMIVYPALTPNGPTTVHALTAAEALVELTKHFPGLAESGRSGFTRLVELVRAVPAHRLRVGTLRDAESALRSLMAKTP